MTEPGLHSARDAGAPDEDFLVLARDAFKPQEMLLGSSFQELTGFAVFISRAAVTNILRHGEKGLRNESEVAGGLVGRPGYDPQSGLVFTFISAALAVQGHADRYEVEIPPEEWFRLSNHVRDDPPYLGTSILVGWYHSHPTFDAYLSEIDQQTQRQFFGEDWNVAIVVAPERRQIKAFHGADSTPCPLFLDPEETGGRLVPVEYEVSAGAVSTTRGIEWVEPADDDPGDEMAFTALGPAAAGPAETAPVATAPPAFQAPVATAPRDGLPIPPFVIGLLILAILLLLILIALTLLNLSKL